MKYVFASLSTLTVLYLYKIFCSTRASGVELAFPLIITFTATRGFVVFVTGVIGNVFDFHIQRPHKTFVVNFAIISNQ